MDVRPASEEWRPGPVIFPMVRGVDGLARDAGTRPETSWWCSSHCKAPTSGYAALPTRNASVDRQADGRAMLRCLRVGRPKMRISTVTRQEPCSQASGVIVDQCDILRDH